MALLSSVILRGNRASQPAANTVGAGTLYYVTDELKLERSTAAAWESYSSATGLSGALGATDNALLRADGTGGVTAQGSVITVSDAGAITFPDNVRQTFNPGADAAGINVGSIAGDPGTPSNGDLWYDSTANELTARINGSNFALGAGLTDGDKGDVVVSSSGATWLLDMPLTPGGRLTPTSNTPVLAADATAQGTIYYPPYIHARLPIYDGTNWRMWTFTERSLTLNSTDNTATNLYDIFVFNNAGTLTLGTGPAWSSATARGTGAGTTELELKDGIWTNKVSITLKAGGSTVGTPSANQATYLGTAYMTANGQTGMAFRPAAANGGTNNFLALYNAYNQVLVNAVTRDSTASWTRVASATIVAMNVGGTGSGLNNRITYIDGLAQSSVSAAFQQSIGGGAGDAYPGMARDSTTVFDFAGQHTGTGVLTTTVSGVWGPTLGVHYIQELVATAAATMTFYGAVATPTRQLNALTVQLPM